MEEYIFIYKDSTDKWQQAKNPVFIAKHTRCRAIPKIEIDKLGFNLISDFLWELNGYGTKMIDLVDLIAHWDIH